MAERGRAAVPQASSDGSQQLPWRIAKDGIRLAVRLTPKASRDEVGGIAGGPDDRHLAVKVRALPSEGAANAALEKLVAKWLGLPQRDVSVAAGGKSRLKSLHLSGDATELVDRLRARLAPVCEDGTNTRPTDTRR